MIKSNQTKLFKKLTPQENSELVQHYLRLIGASYHAHLRDKESLETQLLINQYNRKKKEKKRLSIR
ncbi:hypothetical protein VP01_2046g2 [Puccinia sorghi]|uniref:Uncharacterized protein n=1 Tax=Puccinia sorghi TaxID=27349 RepID=A0A0L6VB21_9BASI|nr:hypothetical protein VP01_2046g2 [Puccinia sorghi]